MDQLPIEIEAVIFGANLDFERRKTPNGESLAERLRVLYATHAQRLGIVEVRALSDTKVEINFKQGALRTLGLRDDTWVLVNLVPEGAANAPGKIATILSQP